ncbi:MAG: lysophospholipid acyltransferase family protein [Cyanothece sp. SIO1E1]|nr:lysophospholipid acyltransferase family protein [Cyanothece sp. SIO1E1]
MSRELPTSSKQRSQLLNWAEYGLYRSIETVLRPLPLSLAYRLMEAILASLFFFIPRFKRRILSNLDIAFIEELSGEEKEALCKKSRRYLSWFFTDMLLAPYLLRHDRFLNKVRCADAVGLLRYLGAHTETGVMIVASHQGAPDVMALALSLKGFPVSVVARPLDNPKLDCHIQDLRTYTGRRQFAKRGALRRVYRALKEGTIVGMQVDQDAGESGLFVPYFGTPASTHAGPATAALLAGVPVVMLHCIRTRAYAFEFDVYAELVKPPSESLPRDEQILDYTRRFTESVEIMARRFPEQVMWGHRRWKTQPPEKVMAPEKPKPRERRRSLFRRRRKTR